MTLSMETTSQLQLITDFLLRNCQEKDEFIQACGIQLRQCRCGIVSSKLIEDLTYLENKINNKEYKSLFSKSLVLQDYPPVQVLPINRELRTKTTGRTQFEEPVTRHVVSELQTQASQKYDVDYTTVGSGPCDIDIIGDGAIIKTISLPPYPGNSTLVPRPVVTTGANVAQEPSIGAPDTSFETQDPLITASDSSVLESSSNIVQDSAYVTEPPAATKPFLATEPIIVTEPSVITTEHSGIEAESLMQNGATVLETESNHQSCATEDQHIVNEDFSVMSSESAADVDDEISSAVHSLSNLNTVAILSGENGPVVVYEQLCDNGQIIVVTSEEAVDGNGQANEITVLAETASLQHPLMSGKIIEADSLEAVDVTDLTEFATQEEKYELLHKIETPEIRERCYSNKVFGCDLCDKTYSRQQGLKDHMITHDKSRREKFKCTVCGKGFPKPSMVKNHMETHNRLKPFQCPLCNKRFAQKSCQTRHMKIHTQEKPYACSICDKRFNQFGHAKKHMALHSESRHKCGLCPRTFPKLENLQNHLALHDRLEKKNVALVEPDKPIFAKDLHRKESLKFPCKYCPERFASKLELDEHDETHAEERPFRCDVCGLRCLQQKNLTFHKKSHAKGADHVCDICGQRFRSGFWLRNHLLQHKGEKSFMCEDCGEIFTLQCILTRHRAKYHNVKPNRKCKSCGHSFPSFKALKHHRAKAHRDTRQRYGCKKCTERFSSISLLVQHHRSHVEEPKKEVEKEPVQEEKKQEDKTKEVLEVQLVDRNGKLKKPCPLCGKLLHPSSIYKHIQAHGSARLSNAPTTKTGQQRKPCLVCHKLISETTVYTHMRIHKRKGEIPDKPARNLEDGKFREACEVCGKLCTPQSLPKHKMLHLDERPFCCDICGKRFNQKPHVTRHKRAKHPGK